MAELTLTDEERETLVRWSRRAKSSQALALRCRIVLGCAEGKSNQDVAAEVGVWPQTVGKWRRRFLAKRLASSGGWLSHPRFRMHFTPTYSSWLNQAERWFGLLTDQRLRRGVHKSIQALEKDIRDWIESWNADPRPFVWTKTADEIFERLASYLQRIPGAGH